VVVRLLQGGATPPLFLPFLVPAFFSELPLFLSPPTSTPTKDQKIVITVCAAVLLMGNAPREEKNGGRKEIP
jgi:hypothetical protein